MLLFVIYFILFVVLIGTELDSGNFTELEKYRTFFITLLGFIAISLLGLLVFSDRELLAAQFSLMYVVTLFFHYTYRDHTIGSLLNQIYEARRIGVEPIAQGHEKQLDKIIIEKYGKVGAKRLKKHLEKMLDQREP